MDLTLESWEREPATQRRAIAKRIAKELPTGFTFQSIKTFKLGDQKHPIALYEFELATFALIPGGTVTLGYDTKRPWEPNPDELVSWHDTADEYELNFTLAKYIAKITTRVREVTLPPLLVETTANELGWVPVPADAPEVRKALRYQRGATQIQLHSDGEILRVKRDAEGAITAERSQEWTHKELAKLLSKTGFRFPTSDEWEYACGGGAQTLFRWGDHVPCDRYPTDVSPEEAAWRRKWVLSGGKLKYPNGGFVSDWNFHRQPNAFGLHIASNPYHFELVAEIGTTRGGDGGSMICGGTGFFVGWLTLATAYFEKSNCRHNPKEPIATGYTFGRRVLELK